MRSAHRCAPRSRRLSRATFETRPADAPQDEDELFMALTRNANGTPDLPHPEVKMPMLAAEDAVNTDLIELYVNVPYPNIT